ncbi:Uroporphyrinogen-III C-methyltransferase [uncultured Defluviicoccus sp.]|uniref:uroporphyrinogen-III C-methyltransferase n=1 Tax=metagenome TaxID=256318 RepID=A0A380TD87_9ZZZZ|nr:Uroporphyrinogen-III C-methyltransferase [uncultured Defluviicoccus sp.]
MVQKEGVVYLVGAGPGDPELLTMRAHRLLREADVVVYDRLVSQAILALIPPGTARISVGKQPRSHPVPQHEINNLLVRLAESGRMVVRLKGGDPFLFGRGSEEAEHLVAHGLRYEVVPGVTSASGCASALGVPLTHRGLASSVRFITGHSREDKELDLDWRGLADPDTTLVIYMGMANIAEIAVRLISNGLSEATPVAAVCNGTRPDQRCVVSTLGEVSAAVGSLDGPTLFFVGRVVDLVPALAPGRTATSTRPLPSHARRA